MRWATQSEIDAACMTRSANEAFAYLNGQGLSVSVAHCHNAISRLIHKGKRRKLATGSISPVIADPTRAHMIDANRRLLRRMLATGHHFINDPIQMAAALRQAGLVASSRESANA